MWGGKRMRGTAGGDPWVMSMQWSKSDKCRENAVAFLFVRGVDSSNIYNPPNTYENKLTFPIPVLT